MDYITFPYCMSATELHKKSGYSEEVRAYTMTISQHDGRNGWYCCNDGSIVLTLDMPDEYPLASIYNALDNCHITTGHLRDFPTRVAHDHIKSPQRNTFVAVSSEQQILASLHPYIDGCLRIAFIRKSSLGTAGVLRKAVALS